MDYKGLSTLAMRLPQAKKPILDELQGILDRQVWDPRHDH